MRSLRPFVAAMGMTVVCIASGSAQAPATKAPASAAKPQSSVAKPEGPVLRQPFTIRLKVEKDHYEELHFDKQPYVSENEVYLFSGDKFGVNLIVKQDRVIQVRYQPDASKADLVFGFEQPKELQGGLGMALTIDNKMKLAVGMEVMGTVPGKKDSFKDKIVPVAPGKSDLEWWPHPIAQLVLGNLRLATTADVPKK